MRFPRSDSDWRPPSGSTIVFVHGAIVNGMEMVVLRRRLARLGYRVRQFHYHSMLGGLDDNVERLGRFLAETKGDTVHAIGHSMGGVLLRRLFEQTPDPRPGRLIAIGSPLVDCWIGRRFLGLHPRLGPLCTGRTVRDHCANPPDALWRGARDFGVLAGIYPFGVGTLFRDLPVPSDGVVLWRETRLEGLRAHATYRLNHFGMLLSRRCAKQMARFLATGEFDRHDAVSPDEANSVWAETAARKNGRTPA